MISRSPDQAIYNLDMMVPGEHLRNQKSSATRSFVR